MLNLKRLAEGKDYFVVTSNGDLHLEKAGFAEQRVFEVEGTFRDEFAPDEQVLMRKNELFRRFIEKYQGSPLVVLELGIGSRNRLIKLPLMQFVAQHPNVRYITLNMPGEMNVPTEIQQQSVALAGDIAVTLRELAV